MSSRIRTGPVLEAVELPDRRKRLQHALLFLLVVLLLITPHHATFAIEGGDDATDMSPSIAQLYFDDTFVCTGSVVGDGWILTAYHCFTENVIRTEGWDRIRVVIWQGDTGTSTAYTSGLAEAPLYRDGSTVPSGKVAAYSDVELLRTAVPMPAWVKTIPVALSWPEVGNTLTAYGYGRTSFDGPLADQLQKSPHGDVARIDCPGGVQFNKGSLCTEGTTSRTWRGDSGGPLLWWENGYWQLVGVFSAYPGSSNATRIYWSTADTDTRTWITTTVGVNGVVPDTILRDTSGTAWLYGPDGYRHWIKDGGTYQCLQAQGSNVIDDWPLRRIEALPDVVGEPGWAVCNPPELPLTRTWAQQQGSRGVNTFLDYHNASGLGPRIPPMTTVQVSCKVHDPTIPSVNPDGYWYRIATPPWNNQYYAPANTFWNGDIPGTPPYTHNTDWAVPDC